jgi:hypothetical protein
MEPAHAINGAALDVMHIIFLRPLQALFEAPIGAVESVRVETNFDHCIAILSWKLVL